MISPFFGGVAILSCGATIVPGISPPGALGSLEPWGQFVSWIGRLPTCRTYAKTTLPSAGSRPCQGQGRCSDPCIRVYATPRGGQTQRSTDSGSRGQVANSQPPPDSQPWLQLFRGPQVLAPASWFRDPGIQTLQSATRSASQERSHFWYPYLPIAASAHCHLFNTPG